MKKIILITAIVISSVFLIVSALSIFMVYQAHYGYRRGVEVINSTGEDLIITPILISDEIHPYPVWMTSYAAVLSFQYKNFSLSSGDERSFYLYPSRQIFQGFLVKKNDQYFFASSPSGGQENMETITISAETLRPVPLFEPESIEKMNAKGDYRFSLFGFLFIIGILNIPTFIYLLYLKRKDRKK